MGEYYKVVNHSKKVYLDPDYFGDSIKWPIVREESFTAFVLFQLLKEDWRGDSIAIEGDEGDQSQPDIYDIIEESYKDVSEWALKWCVDDNWACPRAVILLAREKGLPIKPYCPNV